MEIFVSKPLYYNLPPLDVYTFFSCRCVCDWNDVCVTETCKLDHSEIITNLPWPGLTIHQTPSLGLSKFSFKIRTKMNILQVLSPNRKWALMLWQFIHQPFHFWTKQLELLIKNLYLMQFIGTAISMMQWCHPIFWTVQHNFEIIYFYVFPYLNLTIALADRIITWRNRFREGG